MGLINDLHNIKREEWGKVRFNFRNRLILLIVFLNSSSICSEKFNFLSRIGGIYGIFLPLTNDFRIDQWFLGAEALSLEAIRLC